MVIGHALPEEFAHLQEIDVSAGQAFADIGMAEVASDEAIPKDLLESALKAGLLWVAREHEAPLAFLAAEIVDGNLHIEQVSVAPEAAGRGLGAALIEAAAVAGQAMGCDALTLTTFAQVPWNAPYYERLGFAPIEPDQESPGLRAIRAEERARGLDRWPRLCMIRRISRSLR